MDEQSEGGALLIKAPGYPPIHFCKPPCLGDCCGGRDLTATPLYGQQTRWRCTCQRWFVVKRLRYWRYNAASAWRRAYWWEQRRFDREAADASGRTTP